MKKFGMTLAAASLLASSTAFAAIGDCGATYVHKLKIVNHTSSSISINGYGEYGQGTKNNCTNIKQTLLPIPMTVAANGEKDFCYTDGELKLLESGAQCNFVKYSYNGTKTTAPITLIKSGNTYVNSDPKDEIVDLNLN